MLSATPAKIARPIRYTLEVRRYETDLPIVEGQCQGFTLEAATILVDGEDGLICEVRVLMRPSPVVRIFRDAMYKELSRQIPQDYRELQPKSGGQWRDLARPRPSPEADRPGSDMALHSPMLAKSVHGRVEVEAALGLAHEIQSALLLYVHHRDA